LNNFKDTYNTYYKLVYRFAFKFLGDHDNAADITQDVFLHLYNQLKLKREIYNIKAWLYKVTSNLCMTFLNKNKRITKQDYEKLAAYEADNEKNIEVVEALKKMNKRDRILLTLYSEDISYKKMADITGIKFTSIGKTLSRALKKLKHEMERQQQQMHV
jgi:RNA polymerase sigma-70 factor (ECF subfamily)